MHSIKFVAKKKATKKDGTTPIYIQYSYDRQNRTLLNTGKSIEPKYWNYESSIVRRSHPEDKSLSNFIKSLKRRVEAIVDNAILEKEEPTVSYVKTKFEENVIYSGKKFPTSIFDYLEEFILGSESRVTVDVIKDYRSLKKHLLGFVEHTGYNLSFKSINYDFYQRFRSYLIYDVLKPDGKVGLATNTVGKQIKNLKVFIRDCIKRGITPFIDLSDFKTETEEVDSIYLNENEIKAIWDLNFGDELHLEKARDLFIIGCETGLRFSDFARLKPANIKGDFISIRTKKTHKSVVIPISKQLRKILVKYQNKTPNNITLKDFNLYVKRIGEMSGLNEEIISVRKQGNKKMEETNKKFELISSHTCRRSFCTNQFHKGMPTLLIRKISGHKTEKAFFNYIKVDEEAAARKMLELWSKLE